MKTMCFCNIMWDPFARGEMPQLLSGLKAGVFACVSHNANTEF